MELVKSYSAEATFFEKEEKSLQPTQLLVQFVDGRDENGNLIYSDTVPDHRKAIDTPP